MRDFAVAPITDGILLVHTCGWTTRLTMTQEEAFLPFTTYPLDRLDADLEAHRRQHEQEAQRQASGEGQEPVQAEASETRSVAGTNDDAVSRLRSGGAETEEVSSTVSSEAGQSP